MNQSILFFQTVALGVIIGVVFDIFRILRRVFKHKNIFVYIEDGLFWLMVFLGVLYFILNHAHGQIRFFFLFGIALGIILYLNSISLIFIKVSTKILRLIVNNILKILKKILRITKLYEKIYLKYLKKGG